MRCATKESRFKLLVSCKKPRTRQIYPSLIAEAAYLVRAAEPTLAGARNLLQCSETCAMLAVLKSFLEQRCARPACSPEGGDAQVQRFAPWLANHASTEPDQGAPSPESKARNHATKSPQPLNHEPPVSEESSQCLQNKHGLFRKMIELCGQEAR